MNQAVLTVLLSTAILTSAALAEDTAAPATTPAQPAAAAANTTATATPSTGTITGTVQAVQPVPAAALTAADYLDIQLKPLDAKHKFKQYSLSLNNKQAKHLEVLQVEVVNGISEEAYVQVQQQKSQARRQMAGGLLRGLTGVATSFVPYAGLGSMAAYQAIGASSYAVSNVADAIQNTSGSVNYTGRVMQRGSNIMISPNQQFQCLAVVPEKETPVVKVIFKDLQSNQIYDLQK